MDLVLVAILASLVACTVGIGALSLALGLGRLQAFIWALIATAALAALCVAGLYTVIDACILGDDGFEWRWSPRREFCDEENSPAQIGGWALLAAPPLVAALAVFFWSRDVRGPAFGAVFGLAGVALLFLPILYIQALPRYPVETTPVLHDPYLRVDTDDRPVRACFAYGIVDEPYPADAERVCVDLARTYEAERLTAEYDQGITIGALDGLGLKLTENGMDAGTEWDGLVVERVYRLPGNEARAGASLIRT